VKFLYKDLKSKIDRKTLIYLLIVLGIIFRVVQYLYNRSLWLDESFIALNLMNRSFLELLKPLDFGQAAPLGFILIEKIVTFIFGNSEYALRLFPLVSGIISIFLFYEIIKRWLDEKAVPIALILFVVSERLIYFSSEVKQYSSDVMISLFLIFVFIVYLEEEKVSFSDFVVTGLIGSLAIWFSFSSFFILAGFGITIFLMRIKKREYYKLRPLFFIFFLWGISCILNFIISINEISMNQDLLEYFQYDFMPLPIKSFQDIFWFLKAFYKFFSFTLGLPALRSIIGWHSFTNGIGVSEFSIYSFSARITLAVITLLVFNAGLIFFVGTYSLFLKSKEKFFILISPFFVSLFVSGLRLYPFVGRTNVFLVPIAFIFIAEGVFFLKKTIKPKIISLIIIVLLFSYPILSSGYHIIKSNKVEEIRPVIEYVNDNWQEGDLLYVYKFSIPAFTYYYEKKDLKHLDIFYGEIISQELVDWGKESEQLIGKDRVWFLISHNYKFGIKSDEENLLNYFDKKGVRVESYKKEGASVYLYDFR
jgi:hypothetical protein